METFNILNDEFGGETDQIITLIRGLHDVTDTELIKKVNKIFNKRSETFLKNLWTNATIEFEQNMTDKWDFLLPLLLTLYDTNKISIKESEAKRIMQHIAIYFKSTSLNQSYKKLSIDLIGSLLYHTDNSEIERIVLTKAKALFAKLTDYQDRLNLIETLCLSYSGVSKENIETLYKFIKNKQKEFDKPLINDFIFLHKYRKNKLQII